MKNLSVNNFWGDCQTIEESFGEIASPAGLATDDEALAASGSRSRELRGFANLP